MRDRVGSMLFGAALVIVGMVTASVLPSAFATEGTATASGGQWTCYVVDRFPDPSSASGWRGATKVAAGLNSVAASVPAGTVITTNYPTTTTGLGTPGAPMICVCQ